MMNIDRTYRCNTVLKYKKRTKVSFGLAKHIAQCLRVILYRIKPNVCVALRYLFTKTAALINKNDDKN
jgi:hypothetical protein